MGRPGADSRFALGDVSGGLENKVKTITCEDIRAWLAACARAMAEIGIT
jgi:hypothetical protein